MLPKRIHARWILFCGIAALTLSVIAVGVLEHIRQRRRTLALAELSEIAAVATAAESQRFCDLARTLTGNRELYPPRTAAQRFWNLFRRDEVRNICLSNEVSDQTIKLIKLFPETQALEFEGSTITDEQLGELTNLTNLRQLYLSKTPITDAGMACLPKFRELRWLDLTDVTITDASVEHLARLPHLEMLRIRGTMISAAAAARLTTLKHLRLLEVGAPPDHPRLMNETLLETFQNERPSCQVVGFDDYEPPPRELWWWQLHSTLGATSG